jgi:hypothetical protein
MAACYKPNDTWKNDEAEIIATTVPPTNDLESAVVRTLDPGNYTAIVRGVSETIGVALIEVYALQENIVVKQSRGCWRQKL